MKKKKNKKDDLEEEISKLYKDDLEEEISKLYYDLIYKIITLPDDLLGSVASRIIWLNNLLDRAITQKQLEEFINYM